MPYNNTPIAPSKDVSGQVSLPLARVQKIIAADPDRIHVSKNASFAIALATEMFIQYLATTTHNVVRAERKPRRNIQYRDVASAVVKTDNLEFLVDVVPRTITYKEYKKRQAVVKGKQDEKGAPNGQSTLAGPSGQHSKAKIRELLREDEEKPNGHAHEDVLDKAASEDMPEVMEVDEVEAEGKEASGAEEEDPAAMQIEMEMRGPRANGIDAPEERRTSGFTAINGSR